MGDGDFNNEERTDRLAKAIANGVPDHEIIKQEEMSNEVNDAIYETEREMTEEMLNEAIRRTRQEMGGMNLSSVAEMFFVHYGQVEVKQLIERLVSKYEGKFGSRLYE